MFSLFQEVQQKQTAGRHSINTHTDQSHPTTGKNTINIYLLASERTRSYFDGKLKRNKLPRNFYVIDEKYI
jgi:hypothetical protein